VNVYGSEGSDGGSVRYGYAAFPHHSLNALFRPVRDDLRFRRKSISDLRGDHRNHCGSHRVSVAAFSVQESTVADGFASINRPLRGGVSHVLRDCAEDSKHVAHISGCAFARIRRLRCKQPDRAELTKHVRASHIVACGYSYRILEASSPEAIPVKSGLLHASESSDRSNPVACC